MKAAIYLHRTTPKAEMPLMTPAAEVYAKSLGYTVTDIYADGWTGHPNGWDELMSDAMAGKMDVVISLNLSAWHGEEGAFVAAVKPLIEAGIGFGVVQAPFLGVIQNNNALTAARIVLRAERYYQNVKSLNIRQGMKNKRAGGAPFGTSWYEGSLVINREEWPTVQEIMSHDASGLSIIDIVKLSDIPYQKVRTIVTYWGDKNWQNPSL